MNKSDRLLILMALIMISLYLLYCQPLSKIESNESKESKESFTASPLNRYGKYLVSTNKQRQRQKQRGGAEDPTIIEQELAPNLDQTSQIPSIPSTQPTQQTPTQPTQPTHTTNGDTGLVSTNPQTVPNQNPPVAGPIRVGCGNDQDCNIVFGSQNRCMNNKCECKQGTGTFCHLRPNYYKNLSEMTPAQIVQFKQKGKVEKMTLGDYRNWLSLWEKDQANLPSQHRENFLRLKQGKPIYDIPSADPIQEFFATDAAKRDRICLDIPNSEVDSPMNWKIHTAYNNAGEKSGSNNLNYSHFFKNEDPIKPRYERSEETSVRNWFLNNINWLFWDVDRNRAWQNPNLNRFMNIVSDQRRVPESQFKPVQILDGSKTKQMAQPSGIEIDKAKDTAEPFPYMQDTSKLQEDIANQQDIEVINQRRYQ